MKNFIVYAQRTETFMVEVKARNKDHARQIAENLDGNVFEECGDLEFEITDIDESEG